MKPYGYDPDKARSLSSNFVQALYEDRAGTLWVGTEGGLNRFNRATGKFSVINTNDGLPNNGIMGILEDANGNLWLSTNKGLCRYNPSTGSVRVYDERDGLQADEFYNGAFWRGRTGTMSFGGLSGFNTFRPESVRENTVLPQMAFTKFMNDNPRSSKAQRYDADSSITEQQVIELPFGENFTVEYAALSYLFTDKNRYRHQLEGYDKYWIYAGNTPMARYTNLDPGTYTLKIEGSNYDGVWSKWSEGSRSLTIVVKPPFYRTWWFLLLAVAGISGGVFLAYRWRVRSIEADNRELERLVSIRTRELEESNLELSHANEEIQRQIELLDQQSRAIELANTEMSERNQQLENTMSNLKSTQTQLVQSEKMASLGQLTAGVAHEINNPVNFVSGSIQPLRRNVEAILKALERYTSIDPAAVTPETALDLRSTLVNIAEERKSSRLEIMIRQTDDLLGAIGNGASRIAEIVKGLRNFSRLDENALKKASIEEGLDSTLTILHSQYKDRVSIVKHYGAVPEFECYAGQLNQVFMNILANAVQAIAPERRDGEVRISTAVEQQNGVPHAVVRIKDNGAGMSEEVQKKIFDPFFTTKDVGSGTGLGLSISFGIIEKHKGTINVVSAPGSGAEFVIALPMNLKT
jgi:signal transduction histidine kinase